MGLGMRHVVWCSATLALGSFVYVLALAPMDDAQHPRAAAMGRVASKNDLIGFVRRAMAQGQLPNAQRYAQEMVEAHPDDPESYFYRALIERELGREEAARASWTRLLELLDDRAARLSRDAQDDRRYLRAWALMGLGETDTARTMFLEVAQELENLSPRDENGRFIDPNTHYNLACYLAMGGAHERALMQLAQLARRGFRGSPGWWQADPDLNPLHNDDRFWAIGAVLEERSGARRGRSHEWGEEIWDGEREIGQHGDELPASPGREEDDDFWQRLDEAIREGPVGAPVIEPIGETDDAPDSPRG